MTADGAAPDRTALPIDVMAAVVGAYAWTEERLFRILGAFAASDVVPAAVLYFDATGGGCARHAALLTEQLPRLPHCGPDATVVSPGGAPAQVLDEVGAVEDTLGRLAAVVRVVLPRLVAGYQAHLERTAPVADTNLARVLRQLVHEDLDALAEGEALLQRLGEADPGGLESALAALGPADDALADAGPGFVPWPNDRPRSA